MRILIYAKRDSLKNTGGPSGYLYNISEYLKEHPNDSISFIDSSKLQYTRWCRFKKFIIDALTSLSKNIAPLHLLVCCYNMYYFKYSFTEQTIEYLNSFEAIHLHSSIDLRKSFQTNKVRAKLIVTTHCPEPVVDELFGGHNKQEWLDKHRSLRDRLLKRELMAYELCDNIMFPVPEAREPYEKASDVYKQKFAELNNKFFYVPTALGSVEMVTDNDHKLDALHLPSDALRLCYVGRHTQVKGYDFLKRGAEKVFESIPEARFIIGGTEAPLKRLDDPRWIELGWVNTAKLLNEVDAFILPNRDTYFDLILLEVLRQGTPVLLSRTGGNKWFEGKQLGGLKFFEYGNEDELVACVREIQQLKNEGKLEKIKQQSREFCQQEFNMGLYIKRYIENIQSKIPLR